MFKNIMKACGNSMANGRRKGGVKVHAGMWLNEQVPSLIRISKSAESDKKFMVRFKNMPAETILVFDKAYVNYSLYKHWSKIKVSFVSRLHKSCVVTKGNLRLLSVEDEEYNILEDCEVQLGHKAQKDKVNVRLIKFFDKEHNREIEFITNDKRLEAWEIAEIYKQRWAIELLFKRLKQNIKITSFLGDNENAIRIQIWCALIADLLMQIARKGMRKGEMAYSVVCGLIKLHLMNYVQIKQLLQTPTDPSIFHRKPQENYDLFNQAPP
ncbi:IS4 family transposase [Brumimicrobium oceani]|uniref:IS4 family transposase n=1 Tax=Brumimicrobium oceani TaxID=2100725 RepID=A0A2U2XFS4_9FLAO|nr:IS4 family transposase [Brumimicrobium oceani]